MTDTAPSTVPLIPREVLFGNPEKIGPRLSPDGERLAYLAPRDGVLNVWVGPVGSPVGGDEFEPVTEDKKRGIRVYFWAGQQAHRLPPGRRRRRELARARRGCINERGPRPHP